MPHPLCNNAHLSVACLHLLETPSEPVEPDREKSLPVKDLHRSDLPYRYRTGDRKRFLARYRYSFVSLSRNETFIDTGSASKSSALSVRCFVVTIVVVVVDYLGIDHSNARPLLVHLSFRSEGGKAFALHQTKVRNECLALSPLCSTLPRW